jgi:hypothetical protein
LPAPVSLDPNRLPRVAGIDAAKHVHSIRVADAISTRKNLESDLVDFVCTHAATHWLRLSEHSSQIKFTGFVHLTHVVTLL